ncbi:MAG: hypothetical protein CMN19_01160 [Roseovarius sp.]|nr:hypothetical protein [Roseovarius sp.]
MSGHTKMLGGCFCIFEMRASKADRHRLNSDSARSDAMLRSFANREADRVGRHAKRSRCGIGIWVNHPTDFDTSINLTPHYTLRSLAQALIGVR